MKFLVKTFKGLEQVLAEELRQLEAADVQIVSRGVMCSGNEKLLYRANLELRTGLRVYRFLQDVEADTPEAFYNSIIDYDWSRHLAPDGTLWVTSTASHTPWIRNTMFVSLKAKDAIVDRLRVAAVRPGVDKDNPDLRVHTYVHRGKGSIWLDSTGEPLFKRGYRMRSVEAPINEVLAAGILKLSGYSATTPLVDPMCGGATFPIEAARMAMNVPAQHDRRYFAFMSWPDYDRGLWTVVRQQARSRIHTGAIAPIIASDSNWKAIRAAERNVREAGLASRIELHEANFFDVSAPFERGMLIMNPPYDERLPVREGIDWYQDVGQALKRDWPEWTAWIVSGFLEGLDAMKLRASTTIELDNGGIPVELRGIKLHK